MLNRSFYQMGCLRGISGKTEVLVLIAGSGKNRTEDQNSGLSVLEVNVWRARVLTVFKPTDDDTKLLVQALLFCRS